VNKLVLASGESAVPARCMLQRLKDDVKSFAVEAGASGRGSANRPASMLAKEGGIQSGQGHGSMGSGRRRIIEGIWLALRLRGW